MTVDDQADLTLSDLPRGKMARVVGLDADAILARRLTDMGFVEDAEVELLQHGPLGRDPLAVRVDGTIVAIRRTEARLVRLQPVEV